MDKESKEIVYIRIEDIIPNRFQPRIAFDEKELNTLADSIMKYGIIQPLVVRPISDKYEIIAGERRYKASVIAGLKKVPVIIKTTDDNTSAEIALLENLQRKNLTPIEEAQSYKKLINRGFTQEDIASKLGVSQSSIANKLRLLNLPQEVQDALLYNQISERHARSLLVLDDQEKQKQMLNRIVNEKLTVKQTETEITNILNTKHEEIKKEEALKKEAEEIIKPQLSPEVETMNFNQNQMEKEMEEIRKLLEGDSDIFKEKEEPKKELEVIDFMPKDFKDIPDIININEEKESKMETNKDPIDIEYKDLEITPFVGSHLENNTNENLENKINKEKEEIELEKNRNIDDTIIKPNLENINFSDYYKESKPTIEEKYNSLNLEEITNKIKDFINNLGISKELISVSEIDLLNKYQITIDIRKN